MSLLTNLISHWKLDEASGTSAADAHGSNTGTLAGTEGWVSGKVGNGFEFNEASQFNCGTNSVLNLQENGAISAWIFPDDLGENNLGRIVDRSTAGSGYHFNMVS